MDVVVTIVAIIVVVGFMILYSLPDSFFAPKHFTPQPAPTTSVLTSTLAERSALDKRYMSSGVSYNQIQDLTLPWDKPVNKCDPRYGTVDDIDWKSFVLPAKPKIILF